MIIANAILGVLVILLLIITGREMYMRCVVNNFNKIHNQGHIDRVRTWHSYRQGFAVLVIIMMAVIVIGAATTTAFWLSTGVTGFCIFSFIWLICNIPIALHKRYLSRYKPAD